MELDAYTFIMASFDHNDPDRVNLASVAGYMAAYSKNISKIARRMGRSRAWVRKRARIVSEIMVAAYHNRIS